MPPERIVKANVKSNPNVLIGTALVNVTCQSSVFLPQCDLESVAQLAWRSAGYYVKAGQPDSAAHLLSRASKDLIRKDLDMSVQMLEKAAETVENENRPIQAAIYTNKLLKIALAKNDMREAVVRARKMVELYQVSGLKLKSMEQ